MVAGWVRGFRLWKVDETQVSSSSLRQGNSKPRCSRTQHISVNYTLRPGPSIRLVQDWGQDQVSDHHRHPDLNGRRFNCGKVGI
ncbi:uncharacterized protein V6R79_000402 [Siganus canaliculatus]